MQVAAIFNLTGVFKEKQLLACLIKSIIVKFQTVEIAF